MLLNLDSLRFFSNNPTYRQLEEITCTCRVEEFEEYCSILLCMYPNVKKLICVNKSITSIDPLLFFRLEYLDVSNTAITELPKKGPKIHTIIAANTRINSNDIILNYTTLQYCKVGFLDYHEDSENYPRKVYDSTNDILLMRMWLNPSSGCTDV